MVGIEGTAEAFGFDTAFQGRVLAEVAEGQAADGSEDRTAVAVSFAARVLVKRDVEHPIPAVFDQPVFANRVRQRLGSGGRLLIYRRDS